MDFIGRLKALDVQSATTIAIESLKYLLKFSEKNGFGKGFDLECKKILEARPTAVVLYNSVARIRPTSANSIKRVIKELEMSRAGAASVSAGIFKKKYTVLTHCHSSIVVEALIENKAKIKEVIVTETRPRNQGVRTAKDLTRHGIKVTFIIDSAISDFIEESDIVVVGADALRKDGLVNKVGTHPLALVAKENRKPFYVITSSFTMDKRRNILMEQRPPSELSHNDLKGVRIANPAFDITPWKYVTGIVTEKGVISPSKLRRLI